MAKKPSKRPAKKEHSEQQFFADLFELVAERGWFSLTLPDIAKATGLTLADMLKHYSDKTQVLEGFEKYINQTIAKGHGSGDVGEPIKDKLFDLLMRRLDALQPFRAGLIRLMDDVQTHPLSAMVLALETMCGFQRSMALMLEMSGVTSSHPRSAVAGLGLKLVYLSTLRTWKHDASPDMSASMATLDRGLDRLLKILP